ncbi:hypothetical protein [Phyllobacterium endophyticum]|uniref:hypothetical protein n=1 Tax=Phyllobacterium endophyticum TaxID=1149773 RepID=UPI000D110047|nr:hypothetical protein [Phyllobacterium endophyticum]MBB3234453.1 hypothetical protein [Phyllobacterium endophyticum]
MALSDYFYSDGTITVTNGSKVITGVGTAWQLRHAVGAILFVGSNFGFVESVSAEGAALLKDNWVGATSAGAAYTMWLVPSEASQNLANNQRLSEIIQSLAAAQAESDILTAIGNLVFEVDDLIVATGANTFRVASKLEFTNGAQYNKLVNTLAARAAFDLQVAGYSVLVADVGDGRSAIYSKNSATSADWSNPAYLTGPVGLTPDLTIGTTTTLAPGAAATATLTGTDDDPVLNLGIPAGRGPVIKGAYNPATAYVLDDQVTYLGSSWIARGPTTGNAPPALPTEVNTWWQLVAKKGTDGSGTGDVVGPAVAVDGRIAAFDTTTGKLIKDGGKLVADVVTGPASSVDSRMAEFSGTTGKLLKDGGVVVSAYAKTLLDDANAGAAQTTLGISAFVKTLLDDADAATARTTLGAQVGGSYQPAGSYQADLGYTPVNKAGDTMTGALGLRTAGTNTYQLDASASVLIANAAGITFSSGSGLLILHDNNNGMVAIFMLGGGVVTLVSQTGTSYTTVANTSGTVNVFYEGGLGRYQVQNVRGGPIFLSTCFIRTRTTT